VRFVVQRNPRQSEEYVNEWLTRLGYHTCDPLIVPEGAISTTYGAFASGGFGLTRTQIVDPRYVNRNGYGRPDLAMKEISE